jgi:hypothetical protein
MDYSLVQTSLQEVLTHLCTLDRTDDPSSPDCSDHGGDQASDKSSPSQVRFGQAVTPPVADNTGHSPPSDAVPHTHPSSTPFPGRPQDWGR